MRIKILASVLCVVILSVNSLAHEYWLEPEMFFLALDQKTAVHLYVGDGLIKGREERAFQTDKTQTFKIFSVSQTVDLKASTVEGALPIHTFSADRAGNYLLAIERNWSYIKLEPEKFEDYLREDGIEYIIAERKRLREGKKEGRERYARFIKSLLQVGDVADETYKKRVGLKLEIMPLENPYSKKVGDRLAFQVLFDGKPLTGRAVFADNRNSVTQSMITDREGKISLRIARNGLWLVRLVFMQRCKANCNEADWESFWSAFSFGVKGT